MSEAVPLLQVGERPKITLQQAARDGREEIVRLWLTKLPSRNKDKLLDAVDSNGYTAMHYAAKFNRFKIMQLLVTSGAKATVVTKDEAKFSPLHFAARYTPRIHDAATIQQEATSDSVEVTRLSSSKQAVRLFVQYCHLDVNTRAQYGISPLHLACSRGNIPAVDILLQSEKINVNIADVNRDTPLHEACLYGDAVIVEKLLERLREMKTIDLDMQNDEEHTPLHLACREGHTEVVKLILRYGFEQRAKLLSARDNENSTPLHLACESGEKEIIKILLQNGADLHSQKDDDITALHLAARHGFISIAEILLDSGEDIIEDVDSYQQTPLHYAAYYNQPAMVSFLKGRDASLLAIDKDSYTPLLVAADEGSVEAFDKLLDLGAPLDDLDKDNKSAVFLASEKNHVAILRKLINHPTGSKMCTTVDTIYNTPLHAAAAAGNLGAVKELLGADSEAGVKVNAKNEINKTPMHLAAEQGHIQIVHEFIKKQEDTIEDEDEEGNTPLHLACSSGHHATSKLLIKYLADVSARNAILWTPLDCAASKGHDKIVRLLVAHEAEVDPTDKSKVTPLHLASREGHLKVVVTLLQFGADLKALDQRGFNALDLAIENGHEGIAMAIVKSAKWSDGLRNTTTNMLGLQTTPLRKLIRKMPEVAEEVFNRCTSTNATKDGKIGTDSPDYTVTFNYEFLEDFRDEESRTVRLHRALTQYGRVGELEASDTTSEADVESRPSDPTDKKEDGNYETSWGPVGFKKIQHPLSIMVESARTDLLTHPLVTSLLEYKWNKFAQTFYFTNLALYVIFLIFLTCFALLAPNPLTATCQSVFDGSFGSMRNLTTECTDSATRQAANLTTAACGICDTGTSGTTTGFLYACAGIVIFLALVRLVMEMFQLVTLQIIDYFVDWVNWIELVLFIGTVIFAWIFNTDCLCPRNFQWQLGAVVVFFAWIDLILLIRKLPLTGIYVVMFIHIFKTFCRLLILTMLLVCAFGLSFYMAFRIPENVLFSRTPFSTAGRAIVKTMTMTTGEFEFDNIFRQSAGGAGSLEEVTTELPFPGISFFLWIIFLALMPILLTNLLTGLAVDDIKAIQDAAQLRRLQLKVELALNVEELMPRRLRRLVITDSYISKPNGKLNAFDKFKLRVWGVEPFDSAEKISNALNPPLEPIEQVQNQTRGLTHDVDTMKRELSDLTERNRLMHLLITELCRREGINIDELDNAERDEGTMSRL